MKVLNLYAGIGGNRKLWKDVEVTAVEINPKIAEIYQKHFPNDKVIVADAHQYLLEHYKDFDFIWSSPPCPSHSRIRNIAGVGCGQNEPIYPDMKLYEEIIFLNQVFHSSGTSFNGCWVVENVVSYYMPLIRPYITGRHYFWANFYISPFDVKTRGHMESNENLMKIKGFDVDDKTLLRNCVEPELGLHVFNCAFKDKQTKIESWGIGERKGVSPLGSDSRRTVEG
jgi:DNA (cytosine-5)-methyltransferase 1